MQISIEKSNKAVKVFWGRGVGGVGGVEARMVRKLTTCTDLAWKCLKASPIFLSETLTVIL